LKKLIAILLFFNPLADPCDYPLKDGKPTSKGIQKYVEDKGEELVMEYQEFIEDTLFNVWIYADVDVHNRITDSLELGRFYPHEISISTQEGFIAYELADLSKYQRSKYDESNRFVKSTVFHELTHEYVHQISLEMQYIDKVNVDRTYQTYVWIMRSQESFGSIFIEEGICENITERMGEIIAPKRPFIPKSVEDLTDKENKYLIKYKYASYFVDPFLDTAGIKKGIKTLLHNPPPTFDEILNPDLFYGRLVVPKVSVASLRER